MNFIWNWSHYYCKLQGHFFAHTLFGWWQCMQGAASLLLIKLVDQWAASSWMRSVISKYATLPCDAFDIMIVGTSSTPGWSHSNWLAFFVLGLKRECIYGSCSLMARWLARKRHGTVIWSNKKSLSNQLWAAHQCFYAIHDSESSLLSTNTKRWCVFWEEIL